MITSATVEMRMNPPDLLMRLAKGSELVGDEAYSMLRRLHEIGADAAAAAAPHEFGTLGDSLHLGGPSTASVVTATMAIIGSRLPYFGAQEDSAGGQAWWPPAAPIEAWVARKGLAGDDDVETVAFWIRRKIASVGITPHHFMRTGFAVVNGAIPFEAEALAQRVAAAIDRGTTAWYDSRGRGTLRFRGAGGRFVRG